MIYRELTESTLIFEDVVIKNRMGEWHIYFQLHHGYVKVYIYVTEALRTYSQTQVIQLMTLAYQLTPVGNFE